MFFGCVRQSSAGTDDHPSPNQFLYIYRLMSVNSLIKSPNRASVKTEPSRVLVSIQAVSHRSSSVVKDIERKLQPLKAALVNISEHDLSDLIFAYCRDSSNEDAADDIFLSRSSSDSDGGSSLVSNDLELAMECTDDSGEMKSNLENISMTCESDDDSSSTPDECISYYLYGYVAFKLTKFTSCDSCHSTLTE